MALCHCYLCLWGLQECKCHHCTWENICTTNTHTQTHKHAHIWNEDLHSQTLLGLPALLRTELHLQNVWAVKEAVESKPLPPLRPWNFAVVLMSEKKKNSPTAQGYSYYNWHCDEHSDKRFDGSVWTLGVREGSLCPQSKVMRMRWTVNWSVNGLLM